MNPPLSEVIRLNEIGAGLQRRLDPDSAARSRIARALDLAELETFAADLSVAPGRAGWVLTGRVIAKAVQTCGITLEPLPVLIDQTFSIDLVEAEVEGSNTLDIDPEDPDGPDRIEDGRIDLGHYAVEQLALALDPFPRKPGAEFVQPEQTAEISPFDVLRSLKPRSGPEG